MSIESAKVAVCPECGSAAETRAPSLVSDGWIRLSIIAGVVLLLGLGLRLVTSGQRTLATVPAPSAAVSSPFLGSLSVFGRDGTFEAIRGSAEGRTDVEFSLADARRSFGPSASSKDAETKKNIHVRMGVARSPYLYRNLIWSFGWPTPSLHWEVSSTVWLAESSIRPNYSRQNNSNQTYWAGLVRQWAEPERGFTVIVTWAAIWVAWSFAALGFLIAAALLHRWRHWKVGAALVCIAVFLSVLAWPERTETIRAPIGLSLDQTTDFGLSLAEFDALAATRDGRRELATRVLRLSQERFDYQPVTGLSHAKPYPQFQGVVTKGKASADQLPPDATPVFALYLPREHESSGATRIAGNEWKSLDQVTISKGEFQSSSDSNRVAFAVSDGGRGFKWITIPTAAGYNRYSVWLSRLAIDFGTVLAIPAAVFLLRICWLSYRSRVRTRTGACQICGYDLKQPVLPAVAA
ncbi:MAG: hypothetical protein JNK16_12115 [Phycisphaerales bacterium]|nr:hypothetical protein [Phycisphaerales bacterium]